MYLTAPLTFPTPESEPEGREAGGQAGGGWPGEQVGRAGGQAGGRRPGGRACWPAGFRLQSCFSMCTSSQSVAAPRAENRERAAFFPKQHSLHLASPDTRRV